MMKLTNTIVKVLAVMLALATATGLVVTIIQGNVIGALWYAAVVLFAIKLAVITVNEPDEL